MQTNQTTSQRINVVDSLRGFAMVGIILIHFLEHLNFYSFPEPTVFEQGLWDTVFYLGANKMYAIFSMLFGLSCYIQHHNQEVKGLDFRPRFAWRMVLLFLWGMFDLVFFNGDLLCTYAVLGLFLIPLVRAKDWVLWLVAALLFVQPIEVGYEIVGLVDSSVQPMNIDISKYWAMCYDACANGGFLDVAKANLTGGLQINFGWAIQHGRLTQTLLLFVVGMIIGRRRLFINEGNNLQVWKKIICASVVLFAVTQTVLNTISFDALSPVMRNSLSIQITSWRNFAMMSFYVGCITLLYYKTKAQSALHHLSYIGKMSLTAYLLQSIIGGFLFYHWGLNLHLVSSHGISFVLGIIFCICLYFFCRFWTTRFRRGPLEEIWSRLTWMFGDK